MKTVEITIFVTVPEDISRGDIEEFVEFSMGQSSASADNPLFEEPPISVHIG